MIDISILTGDVTTATGGQVEDAPGGGELIFSGTTETGGSIGATTPLGTGVFKGTGVSTLNHDIDASTATDSGDRIAEPGTTLDVGTSGKTITGALDNLGTLDLGTNTLAVAGNMPGTGTIAFTMGASGSGYIVNTTNTANYAPGADTVTIMPTVDGATITDGTKIALIRVADGNAAPDFSGTTFTIIDAGITWTVAPGTDHAGTTDLNGHTITAADTVLIADIPSDTIDPDGNTVTLSGPVGGTGTTDPDRDDALCRRADPGRRRLAQGPGARDGRAALNASRHCRASAGRL